MSREAKRICFFLMTVLLAASLCAIAGGESLAIFGVIASLLGMLIIAVPLP